MLVGVGWIWWDRRIIFQGFVIAEKEQMLNSAFDLCLKEHQLREGRVLVKREEVDEEDFGFVIDTVGAPAHALPEWTGDEIRRAFPLSQEEVRVLGLVIL